MEWAIAGGIGRGGGPGHDGHARMGKAVHHDRCVEQPGPVSRLLSNISRPTMETDPRVLKSADGIRLSPDRSWNLCALQCLFL
jgi:hypothetical protein